MKQPNIDELCRRCRKESETIQHITAAREQLAPTEYVKRHDGLAKVIHQKLAGAADLIVGKSPNYKNTPANLLENDNFKLFWNRGILTDKTSGLLIIQSAQHVSGDNFAHPQEH